MRKGQQIKVLETSINAAYVLRTRCPRRSEERSDWDDMITEMQLKHQEIMGCFYEGWREYVAGGQYKR